MANTEYPFHTGTVDGTKVVGVLFCSGNGQFYEFVDPSEHEAYAKWSDPRHGDVIEYSNVLDKDIKKVMGGHIIGKVPAQEWADFRETYIDSDDKDVSEWRNMWDDIHTIEQTQAVNV